MKIILFVLIMTSFFMWNIKEVKAQVYSKNYDVACQFYKAVLDSTSFDVVEEKYLNLAPSFQQNDTVRSGIQLVYKYLIRQLREFIEEDGNGNYTVVSHIGNENKASIKEYNLRMVDYTGVYYIQAGNELAFSIVVEHQKVISFMRKLWFRKRDYRLPWYHHIEGDNMYE